MIIFIIHTANEIVGGKAGAEDATITREERAV
jgi:hypothetical protein